MSTKPSNQIRSATMQSQTEVRIPDLLQASNASKLSPNGFFYLQLIMILSSAEGKDIILYIFFSLIHINFT